METKEIYKKIQNIFPDQKIKEEKSGWCSWAFSVGDKIIRIPKSGVDGYKTESKVLSFLKDYVSFEIPQTTIYEDKDFSYVVHEKLVGKEWSSNSYNKLNEESKKIFCQDIALFFSELHTIPLNKIEKKFPSLVKIDSGYDIETISELLKNEFSLKEVQQIQYKFQENQNTEKDMVLIHRDFHLGNSLVDRNHRLKGVFDFVNSGIYDRHCEFLSLFCETEMEMLKNITNVYKDITSIEINFNKLRTLKILDDLGALTYLEKHQEIKKEKQISFNDISLRVHKELKKLF